MHGESAQSARKWVVDARRGTQNARSELVRVQRGRSTGTQDHMSTKSMHAEQMAKSMCAGDCQTIALQYGYCTRSCHNRVAMVISLLLFFHRRHNNNSNTNNIAIVIISATPPSQSTKTSGMINKLTQRLHAYPILIAVYGEAPIRRVLQCNVLVVGAGGIGCELLKNLVLSGFEKITVLDLDTIDVSNLNRQFLFRKQHVGKSKAEIAKESVLLYNPHAQITAFHGNIKSSEYDLDFFKSFTLVFNALDNVDARRHVSRICRAAQTPLFDAGTHGYLGQSTIFIPPYSECYECNPPPAQKTYAVCTIRNTPDLPVHCVVWAKAVFVALFGEDSDENMMRDVRLHLPNPGEEAEWILRIFKRLFDDEIQSQAAVVARWKTRPPPTPLPVELASTIPPNYSRSQDMSILCRDECIAFFTWSFHRMLKERKDQLGTATFEKDDDVTMDCVAALALLRMVNFGISLQSRFALKGIAGNIVHAISTTNAISAGLMVNLAVKVISKAEIENAHQYNTSDKIEESKTASNENHALNGSTSQDLRLRYESLLKPEIQSSLHTTWINRHAPFLLRPQPIDRPSKTCVACSQRPLLLKIDTNTFTLRSLYEKVAKKTISMNEPSIDVTSHDNFLDTIDEHDSDYLSLVCSDNRVRCGHGAMLSITDQTQQLTAHLMVVHVPEDTSSTEENAPIAEDQYFVLEGEVEGSQKEGVEAPLAVVKPVKQVIDSTDDIELIDITPSAAIASGSRKRKHERSEDDVDDSESQSKQKRTRATANDSVDNPIEID